MTYRMKAISKLCFILFIALFTVACIIPQQARAEEWSLKKAAEPYQGTTIRLIGEALNPLKSLKKQKEEFEEITGINVIVEARAFDQVMQKTTADFVAGTGFYDLVLQPHVRLPTLVENGWVQPLSKYIQNRKLTSPNFDLQKRLLSTEWLRRTLGYDGQLFGVPFSSHTIYLNWRFDVFEHPAEKKAFKEEYGYELPSPPVTMKQLRDTSEFFTREEGEKLAGKTLEKDIYGITLSGKRHVSMLWNFYNFLYAFDGKVVDSNRGPEYGPLAINNKNGVRALRFYTDLVQNYAPPGTPNYTWDEQLAAMQTGTAMQALLWADASYSISETPDLSDVTGKVAYSGTPIRDRKIVNLHQWGMFVPETSKNPEAAWLFLQWTQRPKVQAKLMSTGSISLYKDVYKQPRVVDLDYGPTNYYLLSGEVPVIDGEKAYRKPGEAWGVPRSYVNAEDPKTGSTDPSIFKLENFPEYATMQEILQKNLSSALVGDLEPKEALDKSVKEIYQEVPRLKEEQ